MIKEISWKMCFRDFGEELWKNGIVG